MFVPGFQKRATEAIHKENQIRDQRHLEHDAELKCGTESPAWDDNTDVEYEGYVPKCYEDSHVQHFPKEDYSETAHVKRGVPFKIRDQRHLEHDAELKRGTESPAWDDNTDVEYEGYVPKSYGKSHAQKKHFPKEDYSETAHVKRGVPFKNRVQWHLEHDAELKRGTESPAWDDNTDVADGDFVPKSYEDSDVQKQFPKEEFSETSGKVLKEQSLLDEAADVKRGMPFKVMRPISGKTTRLLYKGLSHDGRCSYLKSRNKWSPESKYYFPICSSWDYGWTYGQEYHLMHPKYGRHDLMMD